VVVDDRVLFSALWGGALRSAMRQLRGYTTLDDEAKDTQMMRLFGNVRAAESDFVAGRLTFFPTFFQPSSTRLAWR
jgi:CRISPR-associated protein Cmr2